MKKILLLICLLLIQNRALAQNANWQKTFTAMLKNGGALVEDESGKILFSHRASDEFIPASTIKVATSACALRVLGSDFRYKTEFFIDDSHRLYVKGYGDPLITSEEWAIIAPALKNHLPKNITEIILDTSYFDRNIVIDGVGASSNPYDALNSALLTNFNTLSIKKLKNGKIESAEPQTPLTPLVLQKAQKLKAGTYRINLADNRNNGLRYFGEMLAAFLQKEDIIVSGKISEGLVSSQAQLAYRHVSSQSLEDVLKGLLKYSTNLTINQLFLTMGAENEGVPATVSKGINTLTNCLRNDVGLKEFKVTEGSGLSRQNRVTPAEMIKLLRYFQPHKDLLPLHDQVFKAKTGTINGVNTYIGYFDLPHGHQARYAILVNDNVPFDYKFKLAKFLYQHLTAKP